MFDEDNYLENQMHNYRNQALSALSAIVHPKLVNDMAVVLSYAFREEVYEAEMIAQKLNLDQRHICAVLDLEDEFKHQYIKYRQELYAEI